MQHNIPTRETERSFEQAGKPFDKAAYMAALRSPDALRTCVSQTSSAYLYGYLNDEATTPPKSTATE
jgi:hypothetical protein